MKKSAKLVVKPFAIDELQSRRKRLVYRACHRGMRELDVTFGDWVKYLAQSGQLNPTLIEKLEQLLAQPEPDLLALLYSTEKARNKQEQELIQELQLFLQKKAKTPEKKR